MPAARAQDLKDAGLKATLPRMKVLDLFQNSKVRHMTAEDVYRLLMDDGLDVGLATIYRVLTQFEQAGLLKRHHFEGGKSIFELNEGDRHDHIVCVNTGKVVEFHDAEIERRIAKIVKEHGFELVDHVLHIRALAPVAPSPAPATRRSRR
ncbi:MAG: ferric iron uptake transcriptional regulator [Burkholderiales bacterium]|nr:ferric iron uptake transcriptional regulator [Pseudomonadota bacterium]MCC7068309.1 ferric iron uptake transcriptional regulator [Burkholderiales bacterium]MCZ2134541.1 ferric iron uptake transcriptional regulator [Burkholderiales bacterium]